MIIGRMDKRITLQKPRLVEDGRGGWKPAIEGAKWVDVATVWAEFKKPTFETKELTGTIASVSLREIKIRYRADVVKGWRVVYGTRIFPVDHVYHYGRTDTVMVCKEVVK